MYLTLYEAIELAVDSLNRALDECEKIDLASPQPNFIKLPLPFDEGEGAP